MAGHKEVAGGGFPLAEVDRNNAAELGLGISPLVARKSGQPRLQRQAAQSRKTFRVSAELAESRWGSEARRVVIVRFISVNMGRAIDDALS